MFETAVAFDHLDEIAAMDGIDALTLGPADLAQDMGVFGTPDRARASCQASSGLFRVPMPQRHAPRRRPREGLGPSVVGAHSARGMKTSLGSRVRGNDG